MLSYRRVLATLALASSFAAPLLTQAAIPTQYRLTDLGTLGGSTTQAAALNDASPVQVTGWSSLSGDHDVRGFLYTAGGSMVALNLGPNEGTMGKDINDDGYVVADGGLTGFVHHNGVSTALPALSATFDASASLNGISNSGFVTGIAYSDADPGIAHAFRYSLTAHSMLDLGTVGGSSTLSEGMAVNASGQVAGSVQDVTGEHQHGMFFDGATLQDIDSPGNYFSSAYDLNDSAKVVGSTSIDLGGFDFDDRAFVYDGTTGDPMTLLAGLPDAEWSEARGINNPGQIVGTSFSGISQRAVLWSDDQLIDLNDRLEPSALTPHVVLERAEDINDSGWIVVNGYDTRTWVNHAYLLEPLWP